MMRQMRGRGLRTAVAAMAIGGLVVTGCTTQSERIGADDGSDVCYVYRKALDSTGDFFAEDMVKGAAIGAIGGAVLGGLIGGNWQSAAIGAAAGAVAGAATGYWQHKQQQTQDQAVLYTSVLSDLQAENAQIDKSQLAFNQLVDCRKNEANKVRADYKAKSITKEAAQARMNGIKARYVKDIEIARSIDENIEKRSTNFEFANEQVNPGSTQRVNQIAERQQRQSGGGKKPTKPAASGGTPQQQILTQTASNQAKRNDFKQSVETAAAGDQGFIIS
ncbi:MAG: hypothetical protein GC191_04510 [Azospirillum sp.]|nr:hypothetical protein [Azospirillum sp.]